MIATSRLVHSVKSTPSRSERFYQARDWETGCGDSLGGENAPDRLVFLVSLALLPLLWLI